MKIEELNTIIDELIISVDKIIEPNINEGKSGKTEPRRVDKETEDELSDTILEVLVMAYALGTDDAEYMLNLPSQKADVDKMQKSVYRKIAGEDWTQRLTRALDEGMPLSAIIDTESHRVYNEAVYERAVSSGAKCRKKWVTMEDSRVRDTHDYLSGTIVDLDEDFYTYDGDHAPYPNMFEKAENNVRCRCVIQLLK